MTNFGLQTFQCYLIDQIIPKDLSILIIIAVFVK